MITSKQQICHRNDNEHVEILIIIILNISVINYMSDTNMLFTKPLVLKVREECPILK